MSELVAILDAGSQFGKVIDRRVRELNVESQLLPFDTSVGELKRGGYTPTSVSCVVVCLHCFICLFFSICVHVVPFVWRQICGGHNFRWTRVRVRFRSTGLRSGLV